MAMQASIEGNLRQCQCGEAAERDGTMRRLGTWIFMTLSSLTQVAGRAFDRFMKAQDRGDKRKQMKLVESLALGNRRQLLLVVYDNQKYLVGAGADSVGSILPIEPIPASRDRVVRGPELVRRRGRDANHEARSKMIAEPGLDLWR